MKQPFHLPAAGICVLALLPFSLSAQIDPCGLTWHQINAPNSPGLLIGQASAYDSQRHVAVLFGGHNPLTGILNTRDTWEWNGVNWTLRGSGPVQARKNAAMAYDSDRRVCVLFGGGTNVFLHETPFNDTWEWNGTSWSMRQASEPLATDRPPPLERPMLVYDSFRKKTVLLGSSVHVGNDISPVTRTWEWDGNNWTAVNSAPPPRIDSAMAYDSARSVTVLFGGTSYGSSGVLLADTWTWNGAIWSLAATGGTFPRDQHALAFDARRQVLVLFSGWSGGDLVDTSEWTGTSWINRPFAQFENNLRPRRRHMMWYDTQDQRVVLFGGTYSNGNAHTILDDLWEIRPPGRWVDFNYAGTPSLPETGEFYEPFNTLSEVVNAANPGCTIILKAGSRAESITITKPLKLEAYNGVVIVGQAAP